MAAVREILHSDRLVLHEITVEDLPAVERIYADPSCIPRSDT